MSWNQPKHPLVIESCFYSRQWVNCFTYMNTFNTYSNPMKQVLLLSHFTNEKTGTGKRLSQEWQLETTAAEPTFSSTMFILFLCHQILFLGKSMWYRLQKQKHGQIKPNYCGKQYSHPDRGCMQRARQNDELARGERNTFTPLKG